jgi:hypothetical protein
MMFELLLDVPTDLNGFETNNRILSWAGSELTSVSEGAHLLHV